MAFFADFIGYPAQSPAKSVGKRCGPFCISVALSASAAACMQPMSEGSSNPAQAQPTNSPAPVPSASIENGGDQKQIEPASPATPTAEADPSLNQHAKQANLMAASQPNIPVVYVAEMKPHSPDFRPTTLTLTPAEIEDFERAWSAVRDDIEKQITDDAIVAISSWAKNEMRGFHLPAHWLADMPMTMQGALFDQSQLIFGPTENTGLVLPSHSPLVFRFLMVFAQYHRVHKRITNVTVTIRGRLEE
jgi:hypothetical protein